MSAPNDEPKKKDKYIFARDQKGSIRLNYHHWLVKEILGYHLHPAIPTDKSDLLIADVATGTAIWPIEVARSLPTAQVDGFDISSGQYPGMLPSNVHLYTHDTFQPFPLEYHGKYDIVHIRFFTTLIDSEEKLPGVLKNLVDLIKPGGYLQWVEPDTTKNHIIAPDGVASPVHDGVMERINNYWPSLDKSWTSELSKFFPDQNLEVLGVDRFPIPDELQIFSHHQLCMVFEEYRMIQLSNENQEAAQKIQETLEGLAREFTAGVHIHSEYVITAGKKPI